MRIANLNLLAKAVTTAFGSRILNPTDSARALAVYVHLATQAGFSVIDIRDSIGGCQLATIAHAALRGRTLHDPQTEVMLARVEALLELQKAGTPETSDGEGVRAQNRMTAQFWEQVVLELGRTLTETDVLAIADAYESQVSGKLIPCDTEFTLAIPAIHAKTGELLEMSFRPLAVDGYGYGETNTTYDVVLTTGLRKEDAA